MKRLYNYFLAGAFIFAIWYLAAISLKSPIIPFPGQVLKAMGDMLTDSIAVHFMASLRRIFAAVIIAFCGALPLGVFMGRDDRGDKLLSPVVYFFYPIPKIAFLPVILVLLGLGEASKIVVIAIIVFFHLVVAVRDACRNINQEIFYTLRVVGANRWHIFRHIIFPSILPAVFTALRISLGTAVAVLFVSETIVTDKGMGFLIIDSWVRVNYPEMYAAILSLSFMGISLFLLVDLLENKFCGWKRN